MELEEYEVMYQVEDSHWWYRGMKAITLDMLRRYLANGRDLDVLDAGCGTGAVMDYLEEFGVVTGVDFSAEALEFCRKRGAARLYEASVTDLPFDDGSFDLITSFDVLSECGLVEDEKALREFHRTLRPGGHLLLRLPAYAWLRGKHDVQVHTRHRFTRAEIRKKLEAAGFEVIQASYANTILFPIAVVKRLSERLFPPKQEGSDLTLSTSFINSIFSRLLAGEAPWVCSLGLPFGLTVVVLARRT